MMRNRTLFSIAVLLGTSCLAICRWAGGEAPKDAFPADWRITLSVQAGKHDRHTAPVSVMVDAGEAKSVFVEYANGTLGRAQLVEPGLANASAPAKGMKELYFMTPAMAKQEAAEVNVLLSNQAPAGRKYVWSGESRENRRLSCGPCHQGLAAPTGDALRQERQLLDKSGKVPPVESPRQLPTSKGKDYRWHEKLGKYMSSACWECHTRHMVQYEFGQSIEADVPWAPDPPHVIEAEKRPAVQSVYHTVFRVRSDRALSHPVLDKYATSGAGNWRIEYGFACAATDSGPCTDLIQQHAATVSEEAGKFIGRHNVLIDWVGQVRQVHGVVAREERQVTVKDLRGRNRSYAMWIDFMSTLTATTGTLRLDGADPRVGFRFAPTVDAGTTPEHRETDSWKASTFVSEGSTHTVVCFHHPSNPKPLVEQPARRDGSIGYRFSADIQEEYPLRVHYRLWVQGGRMPFEEIQSMADDFLDSVRIEVKQR